MNVKGMNVFFNDPYVEMKNGFLVTDDMKNEKYYNGTTAKFGITVNNIDYIVKFAKDNELTCYTEYIASRLMQGLGINAHTVYLGKYLKDDQYEIVSILEDFTADKYELHSYKSTRQSSEDTDVTNKEYTYEDVIHMIDKHIRLSESEKKECLQQFWTMYVADAIIANRDRHWGNWGYLIDKYGNYSVAPIYDNGSSLFPGVFRQINKFPSIEFMRDRVYVFPASVFMIQREDRPYRTNYYEIIQHAKWIGLQQAIKDLTDKYTWQDIFELAFVIINPLDIDPRIKEFWVEIICFRYRCIICNEELDSIYNEVINYYGKVCKEHF